MITKEFIFLLAGGLGFFFFGMQMMSDGLKKATGEKLKSFLHSATKYPVMGVLIGTFVTCLIQSSSATTVMTVGFVNAGLLALRQAISVIMGANIGTTFTAWLVSAMSIFKITTYSLPAVGIGYLIMRFGKTRKIRTFGEVLMGFGFLFIGLSFMKDAFTPLKNSHIIKDVFLSFSFNPLLGILAGIIFTVLLQSSSATIAIVQVLAFNGVLTFDAAIPIILGDNIGTTITAQLAALGTNIHARRTAMSHTLFNLFGCFYMLVFVYLGWFSDIIHVLIPGEITTASVMFYIAFSHTFFNLINTIVFLPFIGLLEKISIILVPKKPGTVDIGTQYLEKHVLESPSVALELIQKETAYMLSLASKSVSAAVMDFLNNSAESTRKIDSLEEAIDNLQAEITQYIVELSQKELTENENSQLPVLIHTVNDIERIGDHSKNIMELALRKKEEKMPFTEHALKELNSMWAELEKMLSGTETILKTYNISKAESILELEAKLNTFLDNLKNNHIERLNKKECSIRSSVVFLDFIVNLEKIGDHLTNIAQGIIGKMRWQGKQPSF